MTHNNASPPSSTIPRLHTAARAMNRTVTRTSLWTVNTASVRKRKVASAHTT